MTKIFYLIGALSQAGTARHLYEVCKHIDRKEFHVEVGCFRAEGGFLGPLRQLGIAIYDLRIENFYRKSLDLSFGSILFSLTAWK